MSIFRTFLVVAVMLSEILTVTIASAATVEYELSIAQQEVSFTGKPTRGMTINVITSYSIHYTKLYENRRLLIKLPGTFGHRYFNNARRFQHVRRERFAGQRRGIFGDDFIQSRDYCFFVRQP